MRDEMAEIGSINDGESGAEDEQGEDFDDFEAGAGEDDFGDFDDGFEQSSFFADRSSDIHKVASTEQAVSSFPSPFVSESIAEIYSPRTPVVLSWVYELMSVADLQLSSSPFLILASLTQQTTWPPPARHILTRYFPLLRYRHLLLYPQHQRTTRSSLPIGVFHYGHSWWLHHLFNPQTGFVRAFADCF